MEDLGCQYVEPLYNPKAIRDYYYLDYDSDEKENVKDLLVKAKQHLAAVGWTFPCIYDKYGKRIKVHYLPPNGRKRYNTLRTACKFYLESENGGVEGIKFADKRRKKRKPCYEDEGNVGQIEFIDLDRNEEEGILCWDNRQFKFDDFEMEDGLKEVRNKLRALHLENGEFKFDDSDEKRDPGEEVQLNFRNFKEKNINYGKEVDVGKTKLNYSVENEQETHEDANQKIDNVIEVHEISDEEQVPEINFRNFKEKKMSHDDELHGGKHKFDALENRNNKRRITDCDLYGERMLRCMQGI